MSDKRRCVGITMLLFSTIGCGSQHISTGVTPDSKNVASSCRLSLTSDSTNLDTGSTVTIRLKQTGCSAIQNYYWSVNGIEDGNEQTGTISSTGVYTAPHYPPSNGQVTISVSSDGDMSSPPAISLNIFYLVPASASQRMSVNKQISSDFFGMHIRCSGDACGSNSGDLTAVRFGSMRLWDNFHWAKLEPEPGLYNFAPLDELIEAAKRQGVDNFIFTLGNPPAWAAANQDANCTPSVPGTTCQVPSMDALDQFISTFVQHYCGKISTYEFWNEPDQVRWSDSVNASIMIAQHVSSIAHNPDNCGCSGDDCRPGAGTNSNLVAGPAIGYLWNIEWLKAFLAGGGGKYVDVNTVHTYGYLYTLSSFSRDYDAYHNLLTNYGQNSKPIWDSETDWGTPDPARPRTDDQLASWMIEFITLNAAKGINVVNWYAYNNCLWGTLYGPKCGTGADNYQGLRKTGVAYRELYKWLTGATLEYCDTDSAGDAVCRLTRDGSYDAWIVWAGAGSQIQLSQANTPLTQVSDQDGNTYPLPDNLSINAKPLLIETSAAW
jgi:Beta-galactosidase